MTRKRDRFFALFGALLFLVTASGLTIAVIATGISNHNKPAASQAATQQTPTTACPETNVSAAVETTPEVYKPTTSVASLEKTDLQTGSGPAVKSGDCLQVKYFGTLATTGSVFDENYDKNTAFQFSIGQGQVIQGWDQGLIGAQVGTVRRLVIPSSLAYGSQAQTGIPANSTLVFTVKILAIK